MISKALSDLFGIEEVLKSVAESNEATIKALGQAVLSWSHLESTTDAFLETMLICYGMRGLKATRLVTANVDLREKLKVIVALVMETELGRPDLIDETVSLTNHIGNELRNERNRLFHDNWKPGFGGFLTRRRTTGSTVKRPQARTFKLEIPTAELVSAAEVEAFNHKCVAASSRVLALTDSLLDILLPVSAE